MLYRLWLEDDGHDSWTELTAMSLNQIDLLNRALDAKHEARAEQDRRHA